MIGVEKRGGTLALMAPDLAEKKDRTVLLRHNGASTSWNMLRGLAGKASEENELRLPDMEPGGYTLCWTSLRRGSKHEPPPDELCSRGTLAPFGTLALTLPK